jgi:hypothetical protein
MTSRRGSQTVRGRVRFTVVTFACALLGACAALPDDAPVVDELDTDTGATVTRLGRPLELYRESGLKDAMDRFAFLGPFETNQMGQREQFLWIAVPVEPVPDSVPTIEVNGTALALAAPGRSGEFAGVKKSPYKIPTPWSVMYYFKIDPALVAKLGEATSLKIRVMEVGKDRPVEAVFETEVTANSRLRDFAAR